MARTFSDAPHYAGQISNEYLLGIQIGNTPSADGGLAQMMYVKASELRAFMREGMASVYNYRGEYNTLPTDLAVGDTFYAGSTFSEEGNTYYQGHLYAWNGTSWDDISNIFGQYAMQADLDILEDRVSDNEEDLTDAQNDIVQLQNDVNELQNYVSSGFRYMGSDTYSNIMAKTGMQQGDMWYGTDTGKYYAYNGTSWDALPDLGLYWVTNADGDDELCIEV